MWVRFPARITFTEGNIGSCQLESGADSICHVVACGQDRTALAGFDTDDIVRFHLDRSQISRRFYQSGDVLTHGINTVRGCIQSFQQTGGGILIDSCFTGSFRFKD